MITSEIVQAIDQEIAKLQQVRTLLQETATIAKRGPGRPPKALSAVAPVKRKRTLSAEARAKIAAAQKARWAKARKS